MIPGGCELLQIWDPVEIVAIAVQGAPSVPIPEPAFSDTPKMTRSAAFSVVIEGADAELGDPCMAVAVSKS